MIERPLRLGPETWGEKVHRAYRMARHVWPKVTYVRAAEAVSLVVAATDTRLQHLEDLAHPPTESQRRLVAWTYLSALGFDPADFDLPVESVAFRLVEPDAILAAVDPQGWTHAD